MDVLCEDVDGCYYNIEIQKSDSDDHQRREMRSFQRLVRQLYAELKVTEVTKEVTKNFVINMLKANKDDAEIREMTGLNEQELEIMKAEIFALL